MSSKIYIDTLISKGIDVNGNVGITGGNLNIRGNIGVTGNVNISNGTLTSSGQITGNNGLSIKGDITIKDNTFSNIFENTLPEVVSGVGNLIVDGAIVGFNGMQLKGSMGITGGNFNIRGNVGVTGNVNISNGTLTSSGQITGNNGLTITAGGANIKGNVGITGGNLGLNGSIITYNGSLNVNTKDKDNGINLFSTGNYTTFSQNAAGGIVFKDFTSGPISDGGRTSNTKQLFAYQGSDLNLVNTIGMYGASFRVPVSIGDDTFPQNGYKLDVYGNTLNRGAIVCSGNPSLNIISSTGNVGSTGTIYASDGIIVGVPGSSGGKTNGIFFAGVGNDVNPSGIDTGYTHSAIIERTYGNSVNGNSELLIFKGNDPNNVSEKDRVRIVGTGGILLQTTTDGGYKYYDKSVGDFFQSDTNIIDALSIGQGGSITMYKGANITGNVGITGGNLNINGDVFINTIQETATSDYTLCINPTTKKVSYKSEYYDYSDNDFSRILKVNSKIIKNNCKITSNNININCDFTNSNGFVSYTYGKKGQIGSNLWVAGTDGNNTLAWSNDGKNWTGLGKGIFSSSCNTVHWNGDLWIAGGNGTSNTLAWSNDGKVWTGLGKGIFSTLCEDVHWNGDLWIAGGLGTSNTLAWSNDGKVWTGLGKGIFSTKCNDVHWNGDLWVAGGFGTNTLAWSNDGKNWNSAVSSPYTEQCLCVSWNGNLWVAGGNGSISWSNDGKSWTAVTNNLITIYVNTIHWNGNLWVAGGFGTNTLAWSNDGKVWTAVTNSPFNNSCNDVHWNGSLWVAMGNSNNYIAYSYDGKNWVGLSTGTLITNGYSIFYSKSLSNLIRIKKTSNTTTIDKSKTSDLILSHDDILTIISPPYYDVNLQPDVAISFELIPT